MSLQATVVMLGVNDVERAKQFYVEGMGAEIKQDYRGFVRCSLGEGSSELAFYEWNHVAQDAGVSAEGTGFRGFSFHFITQTRGEVDETIQAAVAAGGTVVKAAEAAKWGGYVGYFSDPDGYLWMVATDA